MNPFALLAGRIGLSLIFVLSGWSKIGGYAGTQQYMDAMGVAPALLPLVIAVELAAGLAVLCGFGTRWAALLLAGFSVAAGVLFHGNLGDQNEFVHLLKNLAISGGLVALAAQGAGRFSIDALRQARARA